MKKPSPWQSDGGTLVSRNEVLYTEAATVSAAQRTARSVAAHFDFHEPVASSVNLPLRALKRLETRAPFALPRCALFGLLLVAALSTAALAPEAGCRGAGGPVGGLQPGNRSGG